MSQNGQDARFAAFFLSLGLEKAVLLQAAELGLTSGESLPGCFVLRQSVERLACLSRLSSIAVLAGRSCAVV